MAGGKPWQMILVSSGTLTTVARNALFEAPDIVRREITEAFNRCGTGLKMKYRFGFVPPWGGPEVYPFFHVSTGNVIPGAVHYSWDPSRSRVPGELWALPGKESLGTELVVMENHAPKWDACARIIAALASDRTRRDEWLWRRAFLWLHRLVTTRLDSLFVTISRQLSGETPADPCTDDDLRNICVAAARSFTARCVLEELTGQHWVAKTDPDTGAVVLRREGASIEAG